MDYEQYENSIKNNENFLRKTFYQWQWKLINPAIKEILNRIINEQYGNNSQGTYGSGGTTSMQNWGTYDREDMGAVEHTKVY